MTNKPSNHNADNLFANKYLLGEIIGVGAHGEVHRAILIENNLPVAIKIFYKHLQKEILRYILKELKVISSLSHPNILKVLAYGRGKQGQRLVHYLVTPLMEGVSLDNLLQQGKIEAKKSIAIILQIAKALQYMHDNNFIHRDVKPQNILCDKEGLFVLADFGIACAAGHTQTSAAGTIEYCAPEQLDNSATKPNASLDIYSLGITLYEMLTGVNPFREISQTQGQAAAIKFKYVEEYPEISTYNPDLPRGLALVIKKMIASNASQRYQKMQEVINELNPYSNILDGSACFPKTEVPMLSPQINMLFEKAATFREKHQWQKAKQMYEKILKVNPNCAQAHNYLGDTLFQLRLYPQAIKSFSAALNYRPSYYSAYCRRAHVYMYMDNTEAAFADLQNAIALHTNRAQAFFYQALLHKKLAKNYQRQNNQSLYRQEIEKMKNCLAQYEKLKK